MRSILLAFLLTGFVSFQLAACTALTGETVGRNLDDATITTAVKSKLAVEKGSSLTRIDVDTVRGVVTLNGVVDSAATKKRAEQIARSVDGVHGVNDDLQIQSQAAGR